MLAQSQQYNETRLGLQCQTPALSEVYFIWEETIILGLKKFGSKTNIRLKKILVPKNLSLKLFWFKKKYFSQKFFF